MASRFWIKLPHETLDDSRLARLPDRLWRRRLETHLLAGERDKSGWLPPLDDMAWRLHVSPEQLEEELVELAVMGFVEQREGRWFVPDFAESQSAASSSERGKRYRQRERKREYYEQRTEAERNANDSFADKNRSDEKREEQTVVASLSDKAVDEAEETAGEPDPDQDEGLVAAAAAYESEIGMLSPTISEMLVDAVDEFGHQTVIDAIQVAVEHNARKWAYVEAVLSRWRADGKQSVRPSTNGQDQEADGVEESRVALRQMMAALQEVCHYQNEKKVFDGAQRLLEDGRTPEQVRTHYSDGGWWYTSAWQGKNGDRPWISNVLSTIEEATKATGLRAPPGSAEDDMIRRPVRIWPEVKRDPERIVAEDEVAAAVIERIGLEAFKACGDSDEYRRQFILGYRELASRET